MKKIVRRATAYLLTFALVFSMIPPQRVLAEESESSEILEAVTEPAAETYPPEEFSPEEPSEELPPEELCPEEPAEELPPEELCPEEPAEELPPEELCPEEPAEELSPEELCPEEPAETLPPEATPSEAPSATEPAATDAILLPESEEFFYQEEIPDNFVVPFTQTGTRASVYSRRIPAFYDSREMGLVTPVQNQDVWQLCWAFSALAVGESYLLSRGHGLTDLSERHLGYYFHGNATDPLGNADGDGTFLTDNYLTSGNNNKFTTFALANWVGAAAESQYPYDEDPSRQDSASAMDDTVHLTNAYWINAQDTDTIKAYIMQNGSVGLSIYYKDSYFNCATAAYYNNAYTATNHAITLVGWDDHYSADHFVIPPEEDGAWLCKNSQGTDFGMEGYFWLSYRDRSITHASATAFVFEFESANNCTWNYHHDGSFGTATNYVAESGSIASIYTASGSSDGTDEEIRAVGFAPADADLNYSIQIYRNLTNPADPTSGTAVFDAPQEGQTGPCGYYSIPLEETVRVHHGETFSVVVTLYSDQLSSIRYFVDRSYQNGSWIRFTSATGPNQTFMKGPSGAWEDLAESGVAARVKAYTVETDFRSVSSLFFETEQLQLAPGESCFQEPGRLPEEADLCIYNWHSDQEQVATVSELGVVTAVAYGEAVITASTPDGRISASYRVSVKPKLTAITLLQYRTQITTGDHFTPVVSLSPRSAASHYTVTLESSDESVVAVDGTTLLAMGPGTAVITVWAGIYYKEFSVRVTHSLKDAQVTVEPAVYNGSSLKPAVTVLLNGTVLEEKLDYQLTYSKNKLPGTATVTVTGTGSYSGTLRQKFSVTMPRTHILALKNQSNGIRIQWESCSGVTGYYLYRQKNSGSWKRIKTVVGKSYWQDTEASSGGAKYAYKVVPYLTSGKNTYKASASAPVTLCRLLRPQISSVKPSAQGMVLSWKKVSGANGYQILRRTPDHPEEVVATLPGGNTLQWTDTSATETGLYYTYRIAAQRTGETQLSLSAMSKTFTACRPETPEDFKAANAAKGVSLSWTKVSGASGYEIQRSTNGTKWKTVKTLSAAHLSWTDTSCTSGAKYFYRIRTVLNCNGTNFRSVYTQANDIYRLSRPAISSISAVTNGFILTWKRVPGADGYDIYRSSDGGSAELIATVSGGKTLSYKDQTASETGITYVYSAAARKTAEEELYKSTKSARKTAVHPDAPTGFTVADHARGIRFSWKKVPHATGYQLQRSADGKTWSTFKNLSGNSWIDTTGANGRRYYYRVRAVAKLDGNTFRGSVSDVICFRRR